MGKSLNNKNNKHNMRKIIQISTDSQPSSRDWEAWCTTTALCDDGTVWELDLDSVVKEKVWKKLPDIPQTDN